MCQLITPIVIILPYQYTTLMGILLIKKYSRDISFNTDLEEVAYYVEVKSSINYSQDQYILIQVLKTETEVPDDPEDILMELSIVILLMNLEMINLII